MGQRYYRAQHEEQRGTGPMASTNCAAASGAMLADQATLGIKDPGVRWFRRQTDDSSGGLRMEQVAAVLEDMGIGTRLYDYRDALRWWQLKAFLSRGMFAVVAGDYDVLPTTLKGAIYDDFHAVVYHQPFTKVLRVGDPLLTGWRGWPLELAEQYVRKFDRQTVGGIHAVVMKQDWAILRDGIVEAEVSAQPSKDAPVLGTLKRGNRLVTGGTVKGDKLAGNDRWRKVWYSPASAVGYLPWTQTWVK